MRILHFSDLHIGVENYGTINPETGLSSRLLDFLATFDEVVEYAISEGIDLVLFAGDAYKGRDPSQTQQRELAKRLAKLSGAGIPTFLLVGNHDLPHAVGRATAVEIFNTLEVPNIIIGDTLKIYLVNTRSGPLQVCALPWPRRSRLLSREESRSLSLDGITAEIERRCTEGVQNMATSLDPTTPSVLTAHVTINGATTGTEQNMMLGRDHVLFPSVVHRHEFDYVGLGHIHKHQVLREGPMVVYSGSLQRIDFTEEEDIKGFCVVDLDPSALNGNRVKNFTFQRVRARRFLTIDSIITEANPDPTERVLYDIQRRHVDDAVVRLRIHVPPELENLLRDGEIRRSLDQAHYVASISHEVPRDRRTRIAPGSEEGLNPLKALDLYLKSRNAPPERKEVLLRYAAELLESISHGQHTDGQG